jgi:hypothetical protein
MCNCPDIVGTDDGNAIITAVEEAWIERGGVVVAHCRTSPEGVFERTNSVVMYGNPYVAGTAAMDWYVKNPPCRVVESERIHPHRSIPTH